MRALELVGRRVGRLVVQEFAGYVGKERVWLCLCDCGKQSRVRTVALNKEITKSCGCISLEKSTARLKKHGHNVNKRATSELSIWRGIKRRCLYKKHAAYSDYGGRGIFICDRWLGDLGFETFLADMGAKPSAKHTLDRIDNDGPYSPENCQWATRTEQARNRRSNFILEAFGKRQSIAAWAEECGMPYARLHNRIYKYKWPVEIALNPKTSPGKSPDPTKRPWKNHRSPKALDPVEL